MKKIKFNFKRKTFRNYFIVFTLLIIIVDLILIFLKNHNEAEMILRNDLAVQILMVTLFGGFFCMFVSINKKFQNIMSLIFFSLWLLGIIRTAETLVYINKPPLIANGVLEKVTLEECFGVSRARTCMFYFPITSLSTEAPIFTKRYRISIKTQENDNIWHTKGRYNYKSIDQMFQGFENMVNTSVRVVYNTKLVSVQSKQGCYLYRGLDPYYQDKNTDYCR